MSKIRLPIVSLVVIVLLFVTAIAGTIYYYNGLVNDNNSKIASLNDEITNQNNEIANQNNEISNLTNQITNLTSQLSSWKAVSANLIPALGIRELYDSASTLNALFIKGTVVNTGNLTAYNAGLKVVAYTSNGTLEINMTVPLAHGAYMLGTTGGYGDVIFFGIDSLTQKSAYALDSGEQISDSLQLGTLNGGQTAYINMDILHEDNVENWTVTPVWTNTP
jgi:hypothetical protein